MPQNPYSLAFGKEPQQVIKRLTERDRILHDFLSEKPDQQLYMITGLRGSGKTVLLTELSRYLEGKDDWIVIELNPEMDLLGNLALKLGEEQRLASIFKKMTVNLSLFGIGVDLGNQNPIRSPETAVIKILEHMQKEGKRLLITIDEVTNSKAMRVFASTFQIFIRRELPVFLLMTGLYENIYKLQNEASLTFLYRAPKVFLKPLNLGALARNYENHLKISRETALKMAKDTRGYPFGFQVAGYFTWENDSNYEGSLDEIRQYLDEYSYQKIWAELSPSDRRIAAAIAQSPTGEVKEVRKIAGLETNQFSPYRKRLITKGIIDGDEYGIVRFTLPYFDDFVIENSLDEAF